MNDAYILHRYPFKDDDVMIKVWGKEFGIKTAVMKGVKRPKSRWRGLAQPFMPLQIGLRGKGEVQTVVQCESLGSALQFSRTHQAIAFYLNELILTFMEQHEATPALFDQYNKLLKSLSLNPSPKSAESTRMDRLVPEDGEAGVQQCQRSKVEVRLREFEMDLFTTLGHGMHFTIDQMHQPIEPDAYYLIQPDALPLKTNTQTAFVVSGNVLAQIEARSWQSESLKIAKYLCRQWVDYYSHGKVFKSRDLLR